MRMYNDKTLVVLEQAQSHDVWYCAQPLASAIPIGSRVLGLLGERLHIRESTGSAAPGYYAACLNPGQWYLANTYVPSTPLWAASVLITNSRLFAVARQERGGICYYKALRLSQVPAGCTIASVHWGSHSLIPANALEWEGAADPGYDAAAAALYDGAVNWFEEDGRVVDNDLRPLTYSTEHTDLDLTTLVSFVAVNNHERDVFRRLFPDGVSCDDLHSRAVERELRKHRIYDIDERVAYTGVV